MGTQTSYVQQQLVYWGQMTAAGAFTVQNGPGLLTVGLAASVYTLTMPANFTIPLNRRFIAIATNNPVGTPGSSATYDEAASTAATVVVNGAAFGGGALNTAFQFAIYRIAMLP